MLENIDRFSPATCMKVARHLVRTRRSRNQVFTLDPEEITDQRTLTTWAAPCRLILRMQLAYEESRKKSELIKMVDGKAGKSQQWAAVQQKLSEWLEWEKEKRRFTVKPGAQRPFASCIGEQQKTVWAKRKSWPNFDIPEHPVVLSFRQVEYILCSSNPSGSGSTW